MTKLQALLGGMCMVALALGPGMAHAQGAPETSPEDCSDRIDNDGDGYVDCYDADCRVHPFCQQQMPPPPPPQYAPPPPQYAPPPPAYGYAPAPMYVPPPRPPGNGVGELVVGLIFLPLGIVLLGTSAILWSNASFSGSSGTRYANAWGGVVMDIFGAALFVVGAIMIPSGIVKMAKYSKWKREHQPQPQAMFNWKGLGLTPSLGVAKDNATLGLKLTF